MGMEAIYKFYYWIFNKSYYEGIIRENGNKIGIIIQAEPNNIRGGDFFLISKPLKKAWMKPIPTKRETGDILYNDGKKFVCLLDMNTSIPCGEEKIIVTKAEKITINQSEIIQITEIAEPYMENKQKAITLKNYKTGKSVILSQDMPIVPALLFELLEGGFVTQTASVPKNKWEELKWVFIAGFIVLGIVVWMLLSNGTITSLM